MPLDAQTKAFLEMAAQRPTPPPGEMPLEMFRQAVSALAPLGFDREEVAEVIDRDVPGPDGDVPVRIYRPEAGGEPPLLVCIHGGSWVRVTLADMDNYYRKLANLTGCVLVAVDYTLAPEAQFPVALEQCYAAARWAQGARAELGCRTDLLGVVGESSGGNMAAALALMARDRGEVTFTSQALILPVLDAKFGSASWAELGQDYMLTQDQLEWAIEQYAPGVNRCNQLLSPLYATEVAGLPPALIVIGEFDPLRDEGEQYAERLRGADIDVDLWSVDGLIHHSMMVPKAIPLGAEVMTEIGRRIAALQSVPAPR